MTSETNDETVLVHGECIVHTHRSSAVRWRQSVAVLLVVVLFRCNSVHRMQLQLHRPTL